MKAIRFNKHVTQYLSAYCHGELDDAETQEVTAHLAVCDRCQKEYKTIQRGIGLASQLKTVSAPPQIWVGVNEKLVGGTARYQFNWRYAWAAVVVLMIGVIGGLLMMRKTSQDVPPEKMRIAKQRNNLPEQMTPTATPSLPVKSSPSLINTKTPKARHTKSANVSWEVASLTGSPRIDNEKIKETGKLRVGEWLETDNASAAKIKVAEIGYVDIDPNSRVQLVRTQETEHRISLAQGKMSAMIFAPPRLFIVDTPSATAVDLGCAYTLEVDASGGSLLQVSSGWVSFVHQGRETFIPAGASCKTRKGRGVGTPYFEDASEGFKAALATLDFGKVRQSESAILAILDQSRREDAVTLWHLLAKPLPTHELQLRGKIFDRLAELTPPPNGVSRLGIINGNKKMMNLWWEESIR